jgi:hypothetical protein
MHKKPMRNPPSSPSTLLVVREPQDPRILVRCHVPVPSPSASHSPRHIADAGRHPLPRDARDAHEEPRYARDRVQHARLAAAVPARPATLPARQADRAAEPARTVPPPRDRAREDEREQEDRPPEAGAVRAEPGTDVLGAPIGPRTALTRRVRDLPVRGAFIPVLGPVPARVIVRQRLLAFDENAFVAVPDVVVLALEIAVLALAVIDNVGWQPLDITNIALRLALAPMIERLAAEQALFFALLARTPELKVVSVGIVGVKFA